MIGIDINLTQPRSGFSPSHLAGLAGWWDPSNNATLAELSDGIVRGVATSGSVGFMQDLSGNGRHMTATTKPTLESDGFLLHGSSAWLTCANFPYAYPLTAFAVILNHTGVGSQTIFGGNATSATVNLGFRIERTSATAGRVVALDYTNPGLPSQRSLNFPASSITSGGKSVLGVRVQADQLANYNQAGTETTSAVVCLSSGTAQSINIGAAINTGSSAFNTGKTGECLVYLGALTTAQIAQVINYLKTKWGVA